MTGNRPLQALLLEDQGDDAELLIVELAGAGYDVEWIRVDDEAGFAAALRADLDIILADFTLPSFNVLRALDMIAERGLTVPFIIVSGTISEQAAVDSLKRGAADYLVKDRIARLPAAVSAAMDQRRLRDAQVKAAALLETQAKELAEANAELQRADALKNQLLMMTAHELRNPLVSIEGFAELLLDPKAGSAADREDWTGIIAGQSRQILRLVEDLLTFSAATLGSLRLQPAPVPVAQALDRAVSVAAPGATVHCPDPLAVQADAGRFQQILVNLLTNAVKYGNGDVRVEARESGDWVEIRVSDDGPGVPDAFVPMLFDTFSRAGDRDRPTDGFGLGLAIVRSLTLAHGGQIRYEANLPSGACFVLRLPIVRDQVPLPGPRREPVTQREGATP